MTIDGVGVRSGICFKPDDIVIYPADGDRLRLMNTDGAQSDRINSIDR